MTEQGIIAASPSDALEKIKTLKETIKNKTAQQESTKAQLNTLWIAFGITTFICIVVIFIAVFINIKLKKKN